jgi:hypothetical protein
MNMTAGYSEEGLGTVSGNLSLSTRQMTPNSGMSSGGGERGDEADTTIPVSYEPFAPAPLSYFDGDYTAESPARQDFSVKGEEHSAFQLWRYVFNTALIILDPRAQHRD